jgi:anti-sigma factor RsiW
MTNDTQHLDFLLSQYVDDVIDPAHRKAMAAELASNPVAQKLHSDHRDVQDMLDGWGNRLPLIDWAAFDRNLQIRLGDAVASPVRVQPRWSRWARPMSIAAGLLVTATVGLWICEHESGHVTPSQNVANALDHNAPIAKVTIGDNDSLTRPSLARVTFPESAAVSTSTVSVAIAAPDAHQATKPGSVTAIATPSAVGGGDNAPATPIDPLH